MVVVVTSSKVIGFQKQQCYYSGDDNVIPIMHSS